MMHISAENFAWPISATLSEILHDAVFENAGAALVICRDIKNNNTLDDWALIEIMVGKRGDICHIIAAELCFDFAVGIFRYNGREFSLASSRELFRLWERKFCLLHQLGVFKTTVNNL